MENQKNYAQKILEDYAPHEKTKLDELRKLDKKAKLFPSVFAYTLGIAAALILGTGMCLAMQVIGSTTALMVTGIVVGCAGIALCIANYYIYRALLKKSKAKYGDRIINLSNELLNTEN